MEGGNGVRVANGITHSPSGELYTVDSSSKLFINNDLKIFATIWGFVRL